MDPSGMRVVERAQTDGSWAAPRHRSRASMSQSTTEAPGLGCLPPVGVGADAGQGWNR